MTINEVSPVEEDDKGVESGKRDNARVELDARSVDRPALPDSSLVAAATLLLDDLGRESESVEPYLGDDPPHVARWVEHLRSDRLLLLSASDRALLQELSHRVIGKIAGPGATIRAWAPTTLRGGAEPSKVDQRKAQAPPNERSNPPTVESANAREDDIRFEHIISGRRRQGGAIEGQLFLLVSALDSDAQLFVDSLPVNAGEYSTAQSRLVDLETYVVIILKASRLTDSTARMRADHRRRGELRAELSAIVSRLGQDAPESLFDGLRRFLEDAFDEAGLRGLLIGLDDHAKAELPTSGARAELALKATEFLQRRNLIKDRLFERLEAEHAHRREEIRELRQQLNGGPRALVAKHAQLSEELRGLDARFENAAKFPGKSFLKLMNVPDVEILAEAFVGHDPGLWSKLMQQIADGKWGDHAEEQIDFIRDHIGQGTLAKEIEKLSTPGLADKQLEQNQEISTLDLLVIFVASHIPRIDPDDFEEIIRVLIEGETALAAEHVEEEEDAQPRQEPDDAKAKEQPTIRRRSLVEQWATTADSVLERAGLEVRLVCDEQGQDRQAIQWRQKGQQRKWLDAMASKRYFFRARQIQHLQGVFISLQSGKLFADVLKLLVDHAALNPNRRAKELLQPYVDQLVLHLSGEPATSFAELHQQIVNALNTGLLLSRMAFIMREMQSRAALRAEVDAALNALISTPLGEPRVWAFRLTRDLRGAPEFDDLKWLGQLCERGGGMIFANVLAALHDDVMAKGPNAGPLLDKLDEWWPEDETPKIPPRQWTAWIAEKRWDERLSQRHRLALNLVVRLVHGLEPQPTKAWPPEHALFDWARGMEAGEKPRLVRWLLHSRVEQFLTQAVVGVPGMLIQTVLLPLGGADLPGLGEEARDRLEGELLRSWLEILRLLASDWVPAEALEGGWSAEEARRKAELVRLPLLFPSVMIVRWMDAALTAGRGGDVALERFVGPFLSDLGQEQIDALDIHLSAIMKSLRDSGQRLEELSRGQPAHLDAYAAVLDRIRRLEDAALIYQTMLTKHGSRGVERSSP